MLLASLIVPQLNLEEDKLKALADERQTQEAILGMLLLTASLAQLKELETLPDVLEKRGLYLPKAALLYALGHRDELRKEGFTEGHFPGAKLDEFMELWLDQPAKDDIPARPNIFAGTTVQFETNVLGCNLHVSVANNKQSIYLAESLLGAVEAFLSTSLDAELMPYRSDLQINVFPSSSASGAPRLGERKIGGETTLEFTHPVDLPKQTDKTRNDYRDALQAAIVGVLVRIAIIDDPEAYLTKIAGDEHGFGRALSFSEIEITTGNIIGTDSDFALQRIAEGSENKRYALQRSEVWTARLAAKPTTERSAPQYGEGAPPPDWKASFENIAHRERPVFSLIDIPRWNKAKWRATLYLQDPSKEPPLLLGLGFKDIEPAREIFTAWQKKLGRQDQGDELRVTIITGVMKSNPACYNVIIGTNLKLSDENRFAVTVSRINQMTPDSSANLDRFLASFAKYGSYLLAPVEFRGPDAAPVIHPDVGIVKRSLIVRPAWQIGENDPDVMGVTEGDDPIVPDGVIDAPILRTLARRAAKKA